jgi:hypothetical protein
VGFSTGVGDDRAVVGGEDGLAASEPEQATKTAHNRSPIAVLLMGIAT